VSLVRAAARQTSSVDAIDMVVCALGGLDSDQLEGDQVGVAGSGAGDVKHRGGLQGGGFVVGKHDLHVCTAQVQGVDAAGDCGAALQGLHGGAVGPASV